MARKKFEDNMIRCHIKIEKVFFPKEDFEPGGWAVFSASVVKTLQGEPILSKYNDLRLSGNAPSLSMNKTYTICGTYSYHEKYGDQYKMVYMNEVERLTDPADQKAFLRTVLTDFQMESLYECFENPFDLIERNDVNGLCKAEGIGKATAESIVAKYDARVDNSHAYAKLIKYGLTAASIDKLIGHYRSADVLVAKIEQNPYVLIDDVYGIGWQKADALAMNMGHEKNSQFRVEAYIMHFLAEYAESGNSMVQAGKVINNCMSDLGLNEGDRSTVRDALFHLHDVRNTLWWSDDRSEFALERVRELEWDIAQELKRLTEAPVNKVDGEIDAAIMAAEKEVGLNYTDEQKDAIKTICANNVCILTGLGGTGKTSVVAGVLKVLKQSFTQTALSGRAAARMQEVTGEEGSTIHRMLGYNPATKEFSHNKEHPLLEDIVILDETSMVGAKLFYDLIQAIQTGHRLIMIGDDGQLESIGLCNIFKDMLTSGYIPVARLTKIHRQAAKSAIITESIKVRNAAQLIPYGWTGDEIRGELRDLQLDVYKDADNSFDRIVNQYRTLYNKVGGDCSQIQIVLPQRTRGSISTFNVNNEIQKIVNPKGSKAEAIVVAYNSGQERSYVLREGDQVILNKNNYKLKHVDENWEDENEACPVYNGNRGVIKKIEDKNIFVDFDQWGMIRIPSRMDGENMWATLELAYALTCHKLQGSEAPYVIVGLDFSARIMLTREWLYTAITRAKKYCVICAETKALDFAVKTSNVPFKRTFLKKYLQEKISEKG